MEEAQDLGIQGNCTDYGGVDNRKFSDFTPLVGRYVALASLACAVCIGLDLVRSLTRRKPWIAAKFFALNATTLTILAVAIKIPSDTSAMMPGLFDQLAKLSGIVLVCISMNHMLPSLGSTDDRTILSNVIALGILVITLFVNVLFQLRTGLITRFFQSSLIMSLFMLFIFSIFISHALTVSTVRKLLAKQYETKHKEIEGEIEESGYLTFNVFPVEKLRDYMYKYWLMALTSSPDYTLRSSGMAFASTLVCYVLLGFFFIAVILTSAIKQWHQKTTGCYARSEYKSSTGYIFGLQVVAIVVGTLASLLRGMNFKPVVFMELQSLLKVEGYRIKKLEDWRDAPLSFYVSNKGIRWLIYKLINSTLFCFILLQKFNILLTKFISFVLMLPFIPFYFCCRAAKSHDAAIMDDNYLDLDAFGAYVLHVEGTIPLSDKETLAKWLSLATNWMEGGRQRESTMSSFLREFSTPSQGFPGAAQVYNNSVQETIADKLPNCWSLTLVTFAAVIHASFKSTMPNESISTLMKATDECFRYAVLVDENFSVEGSSKMIEAARKVWDTVYLFNNWMREDLRKVEDNADSLGIIRKLRDMAQKCVEKAEKESTGSWPLNAIAANCMYKITWTIYVGHGRECKTAFLPNINKSLFSLLKGTLADIMGACLANVPSAIIMNCSRGKFGARENKVREAAIIFGEVEHTLRWLGRNGRLDRYQPAAIPYIDSWQGQYAF